MTNLLCPHCDTSVDEHEAGRCLDAWVARDVMGLEPVLFDEPYGGLGKPAGRRGWYIPPVHPVEYYSTDIAAAWEVVERSSLSLVKTKEGWLAGQYDLEEEYLDVEFGVIDGHFSRGYATADTAYLAICRAALKAVGE